MKIEKKQAKKKNLSERLISNVIMHFSSIQFPNVFSFVWLHIIYNLLLFSLHSTIFFIIKFIYKKKLTFKRNKFEKKT
jgi:hypothetical protein